MTRAQRMHRRLVRTICYIAGNYYVTAARNIRPACSSFGCPETARLEIDHPEGRRRAQRNRNPEHRRKSYAARVRELWLAFAAGEPLRVLCRSCNAREGGGRRYT